jgi:hypothetical protein
MAAMEVHGTEEERRREGAEIEEERRQEDVERVRRPLPVHLLSHPAGGRRRRRVSRDKLHGAERDEGPRVGKGGRAGQHRRRHGDWSGREKGMREERRAEAAAVGIDWELAAAAAMGEARGGEEDVRGG